MKKEYFDYIYILILSALIAIIIWFSYNFYINNKNIELTYSIEQPNIQNTNNKKYIPHKVILKKEKNEYMILPKLQNPFKNMFENNNFEKNEEEIEKIKSEDSISPSNLILSGILIKNNKRFAIINDKIVKKGDIIFNSVVTKILSNEVILQNNKKKYVIKMNK